MKVLVLGSGGREHAMAWRFCRDGHQVWVAPGNAGTAQVQGAQNLQLDDTQIPAIVEAAARLDIDLVVPGSEAFLEAGVADALAGAGVPCFGPSRAAAMIETSKAFSKQLFFDAGVPTARGQAFTDPQEACAYALDELGGALAIKADGLAAGKGVVLARTAEEAEREILRMMRGDTVGDAGRKVVLEELLEGEEVSFTALTDGSDYLLLPSSQDHKARDEGNRGPNTGGMGACSPAPALTPALREQVVEQVVLPVIGAMQERGTPYVGVLYIGLMLGPGGIRVIEINCRLGDPETQVLLPRLDGLDLAGLCAICAGGPGSLAAAGEALDGRAENGRLREDPRACLGVVVASEGYPGAVRKGLPMQLPQLRDHDCLFLAGAALGQDGQLCTNGGRVACTVALAETLAQAQERALQLASGLDFAGAFFRRDIGWQSIEHERNGTGP